MAKFNWIKRARLEKVIAWVGDSKSSFLYAIVNPHSYKYYWIRVHREGPVATVQGTKTYTTLSWAAHQAMKNQEKYLAFLASEQRFHESITRFCHSTLFGWKGPFVEILRKESVSPWESLVKFRILNPELKVQEVETLLHSCFSSELLWDIHYKPGILDQEYARMERRFQGEQSTNPWTFLKLLTNVKDLNTTLLADFCGKSLSPEVTQLSYSGGVRYYGFDRFRCNVQKEAKFLRDTLKHEDQRYRNAVFLVPTRTVLRQVQRAVKDILPNSYFFLHHASSDSWCAQPPPQKRPK